MGHAHQNGQTPCPGLPAGGHRGTRNGGKQRSVLRTATTLSSAGLVTTNPLKTQGPAADLQPKNTDATAAASDPQSLAAAWQQLGDSLAAATPAPPPTPPQPPSSAAAAAAASAALRVPGAPGTSLAPGALVAPVAPEPGPAAAAAAQVSDLQPMVVPQPVMPVTSAPMVTSSPAMGPMDPLDLVFR